MRAGSFNLHRRGRNRDLLLHRAYLKLRIGADNTVRINDNVLLLEIFEAWMLYVYGVCADWESGKRIETLGVSGDRLLNTGLNICSLDGGASDNSPAWIGHDT